jgi:hypothetical protein
MPLRLAQVPIFIPGFINIAAGIQNLIYAGLLFLSKQGK